MYLQYTIMVYTHVLTAYHITSNHSSIKKECILTLDAVSWLTKYINSLPLTYNNFYNSLKKTASVG